MRQSAQIVFLQPLSVGRPLCDGLDAINAGGHDVDRSAARVPFDRLAVGEITAANSPDWATEILGGVAGACSGIKCGENRTGTESETSGDSVERHALNSHSLVTVPRPAIKPEADTLLPSVSGLYSPWQTRQPFLEPRARRASA